MPKSGFADMKSAALGMVFYAEKRQMSSFSQRRNKMHRSGPCVEPFYAVLLAESLFGGARSELEAESEMR